MYEHFLTKEQTDLLINKFGFIEIPTQKKLLVCGDYGDGALASPSTIFEIVNNKLNKEK